MKSRSLDGREVEYLDRYIRICPLLKCDETVTLNVLEQ